MDAIEKRIAELGTYMPDATARPDLEEFWRETLRAARARSLDATLADEPLPFAGIEARELSFSGFDETRIHAWYVLPERRDDKAVPCVVHFSGYRSDRGLPEDYAAWALMGCAVLAVDTRGQCGKTGNFLPQSHGIATGWVSQGLLDKESYYYRAVFMDCVRALDWLAERPEIDASRICACGASQGGGLALAAAALSGKVAYTIADIPNLCHIDLGILQSEGSLAEVADYLNYHPESQGRVLETLSYFDIANLAPYIETPVAVSVCLKDLICLPETVFAAYNRIRSEKTIRVYPFETHTLPAQHYRDRLVLVKRAFGL